ncbi:MAG TPA: sugar phosphate isomerase/epimerase, partial [Terriglobales bacterium]|nr:sugar phosphate isomerase/epimerase [Terriglobales bacterium]
SNWHSNRREFLTATGGLVAATLASGEPLSALAAPGAGSNATTQPNAGQGSASNSPRKLLIGVFDPVYNNLTLEQMLEKISALRLEAVEIGTGGYPAASHCPVQELLADPAKARAWKKKFEDRNIVVAAFSCHGNPVHPDPKIAARDAQTFRNTVLLAERLEVPVIVGFSGCPGGSPTDTMPNWATYRWPPEYAQILDWQWKEKIVPYWKEAAAFARQHGVHKLAFEMHPGFCVYNPKTLLRLREAVGEQIGANCDLSHLFWQECDPVEVIRLLGKQGAIFHAHMKDTVLFKDNIEKYGVLNFAFEPKDIPSASAIFRAVGYGHGASLWKDVVRTYMEVGYSGILSIENEDPILPGEVGVERAAFVLKNVRDELLNPASGAT